MADEYQPLPLTRRQRRTVDVAEALTLDPDPLRGDRAYLARPLVQATLPHRDPGDVPEWARQNGNFSLSMQPGYSFDPKSGERYCVGYPYGSLPRLLLFWMNTEAVRTKDRRLYLGDTLAGFLRELGLDYTRGGRCSDGRRLREQMDRLFYSRITFEYAAIEGRRVHKSRLAMEVAPKSQLWFDLKRPDQGALWGSYIELGEDFFKAITESAVPLDLRVLRSLKQSPLALDLYAWMLHRAYGVTQSGKQAEIPWRSIMGQIGADYARVNDFSAKARAAVFEIQVALMGTSLLNVEVVRGGLLIRPGRPQIGRR